MKKQVLSIEQMQELIALGVDTSKASMCWNYNDENSYWALVINYTHSTYIEGEIVPTFTLHDIINILPQYIEDKEIGRFDYELRVKKDEVTYESYDAFDKEGEPYVLNLYTIDYDESNSILDCAFEMLKWCIKEKYIEDGRTGIKY